MSRRLDDLDPRLKPIAFELIARGNEAGIPTMIIDTLRTDAEHQVNLAARTSWTANSKHLPQPPSGLSLAIDLCPYDVYQLDGPDKLMWRANHPSWQTLGAIGKALGLRWGGDWQQKDLSHFEYVVPATTGVPV